MEIFDGIYNLIGVVLPFEWAQHIFMKNAILAICIATPLFGMLGVMIINNKMAFFSDSIGHGAFTGIAIGSLLGSTMPIWSAAVFSVIFAIGITVVKNKSKNSPDTIIGVFSATAVALGLIIMSISGNQAQISAYLIGDLLSITPLEISLLLMVLVIVAIIWNFIFNSLLIISINPSLARSRKINTNLNEIIFTTALAVVVSITIQWVGLLIINALLIVPAASARNVSNNIRQYHFLSIIFSLFSGFIGLFLSYEFNTVSGATIVIVLALIFFTTLIIKNQRNHI
ncbi:MAG: metal ABC transporter permease [Eubacteriales bacterium]